MGTTISSIYLVIYLFIFDTDGSHKIGTRVIQKIKRDKIMKGRRNIVILMSKGGNSIRDRSPPYRYVE